MRYFNTAGPCKAELHYMVPAEPRLPDARPLIENGQYFVVHAPRQTGKTTTLRALARELTAEGRYVALLFSCETGEAAGDNYESAQRDILSSLRREARLMGLAPELMPPDPWPDGSEGQQVSAALSAWAEMCPRPLVLFVDEIDALRGQSLVSVLRQLRDGYWSRPGGFPHSVALCGLRDVRDYKAAAGGDPDRLGTASPFNVNVESLRLGDFVEDDMRMLYRQHTEETGQVFTEGALEAAWSLTQGQPWLTNALARQITSKMKVPVDRPITAEHLGQARHDLILQRAVHLDSLVDKLRDPRVRRVVEPLVAGLLPDFDSVYNDDVAYVRDLGLIAVDDPVRIANPIYHEVVARTLGAGFETVIASDPRSFVTCDGRLDFPKVLHEFADFWRQNGEVMARGDYYHEAACQLVLMAYLQRVVNGGGQITREYGLGYRRIDLHIRWPYTDHDGKQAVQQEAIELKVWRADGKDPLPEGLAQLDDYLARLGLDRGTLVIFDRRPSTPPIHERALDFTDVETPAGRSVTLLRA